MAVKKKTQKRQGKQEAPQKPATLPATGKALNDFFDRYGLATYLVLALVIILVIFKDFLSLEKVYLFKDIGSDSINIFYPYLAHIADYFRSEGLPKWSFSVGMGQNMYMFEQGNPFSILLYVMGAENIPYGIVYTEVLKIIVSGIFIYYYLKTLNISSFLCVCGALMYAFCGYMILGGTGWYAHSTEAFYASVFLFGVERFISRNQWYWLTFAVFTIGCIHSFFLFSYGILFVFYFFVRIAERKELEIKTLLSRGLLAAGSFLLGVLMSAVFVINYIQIIYNSPRVSGSSSAFDTFLSKPIFGLADSVEYVSFLMRLFSNDLIGNGNNFKGWGNYLEAPILYIGISCLLMFGQFFTKIDKYKRKVYLISTGFVVMVILFPFFRYAFWGFGLDYFRTFSFFISLYIFYIAMRGAQNMLAQASVNRVILFSSLILCLVVLYGDYAMKEQLIQKGLRSVIVMLLFLYALLIYMLQNKSFRHYAQVGFLLVLCFELSYFSRTTVLKRDAVVKEELVAKKGYNDYTLDAMAYLNKTDTGFFRVNKTYASGLAMHSSLNDALVQQYKGTVSYSSFNQKYYIQFLQGVNAIKQGDPNDAKWAQGVSARPVLQSLVSTKYTLSKVQPNPMDSMMYKKGKVFGDVQLYENKTFLPLGIVFDQYIRAQDFEKFSGFAKDVNLLKAFVIEDIDKEKFSGISPMNLADTLKPFSWNEFNDIVQKHRSKALQVSSFSNNKIEGKITLDKKQALFLSIPYDEGWKLSVDGNEQPLYIVNFGLMGAVLDKGAHTVSLAYHPPFMKTGILLSLGSVLLFAALVYRQKRNKNAPES